MFLGVRAGDRCPQDRRFGVLAKLGERRAAGGGFGDAGEQANASALGLLGETAGARSAAATTVKLPTARPSWPTE